MSEYHRLFVKGGTYFFTVVTYDRQPLLYGDPAFDPPPGADKPQDSVF